MPARRPFGPDVRERRKIQRNRWAHSVHVVMVRGAIPTPLVALPVCPADTRSATWISGGWLIKLLSADTPDRFQRLSVREETPIRLPNRSLRSTRMVRAGRASPSAAPPRHAGLGHPAR
jgi:hypothetical protein